MLEMFCPLRPPKEDGTAAMCRTDCAWLLYDGDGQPMKCAIIWLPRLTAAVEAQTELMKGLMAGFPGFPGEGH